jgi:sigma-B regulation protein RsbU (phosphoserine phosphatase)
MMDAMAAKAATLGVFGRSLESLLRQIEDNQVRRQEMAVAKHIQQSVLPKPLPDPDSLPVLLDAFMRPTREVGGDLYDYFHIDATHLALIIADVSGKGVPASLFMMRCRTVLHSLATSGLSVEQCVSRTNAALTEDNDLCIFVTLFFAVLDLETGRMTYCNAGHNPPYLLAADGRTTRLGLTGPAAAVIDGAVYETGGADLAPGDLLFLYTDGITDALSTGGELYGEERLSALVDSLRNSPPADVVAGVVAAVDSFAEGAVQYDDITCLALTRR